MEKKTFHLPKANIFLAAVSFLVSGLSFTGILLKNDMTGRIIFGCVWLFVGILWMSGLLKLKRGKKLTSER